MAHILIFDVPGGNDFAVIEDALALGHQVTFCTSDLSHYWTQGDWAKSLLEQAQNLVEIPGFDEVALLSQLDAIHAQCPIEAVICLIDIRLMAAAKVAQRYGLRFLSPEVVQLTRNKTAVRSRLEEKGLTQPGFAQAGNLQELMQALEKTGYPAIIKPSDGYGSESLFYLNDSADLDKVAAGLFSDESSIDYGLGVHSNRLFSVEPYMQGQLLGVDVFSDGQSRLVLGINAKKMFTPPFFAIAGSCYPSDRFNLEQIQAKAFAILDAIGFDFGAAHIEMILTDEGLYLVEVNARLVSAQIPYQMAYAFERSIYADLIDLHLGVAVEDMIPFERHAFSVIRWIIANQEGKLEVLELPDDLAPNIQRVVLFKGAGDIVRPPKANADRIGYVIATASSEAEATSIAETFISNVTMRISECVHSK